MAYQICRRDFLKAGAAVAAFHILPSGLLAASPSGKLRTAHIGVGGMQGGSDLNSVSSHAKVEVAALCDIDANHLKTAASRHPSAKTFHDYRELLAEMGDSIDAVVISTPDHTHAAAAMTAMNHGKGVYCQKPLTHDIHEARQLRLAAERKGLLTKTQMGIQGHASSRNRMATEMIQNGILGKVSRVVAWSNKNWGYDGGPVEGEDPVPDRLDWNLWIGTAAMRPYKVDAYHPINWRKMIDFGTGTLGDMGVHIFDTPYRALKLTAPTWAKTTCRPPTGIGHPEKNAVEYEFPGTEYTTETLTWTWYDGANAPPADRGLPVPEGTELPDQGAVLIGEGSVMLLPHGRGIHLFPEEKFRDTVWADVEEKDHYHEWVNACLGEGKSSAHFGYAGPLTEALLLGVVANRFPDMKLTWNAESMRVMNVTDANKLLKREYRQGFEVEGL
jgi:predicted dehydrogenase